MTMDSTFGILAVFGGILTCIEEVGGAWSSASMSQIILSDFVSIAAVRDRVSSDKNTTDYTGLLEGPPPFLVFLLLYLLDIGVVIVVTNSVGKVSIS